MCSSCLSLKFTQMCARNHHDWLIQILQNQLLRQWHPPLWKSPFGNTKSHGPPGLSEAEQVYYTPRPHTIYDDDVPTILTFDFWLSLAIQRLAAIETSSPETSSPDFDLHVHHFHRIGPAHRIVGWWASLPFLQVRETARRITPITPS